jgi:asparagine synthase (glutamine-hydrolysing)
MCGIAGFIAGNEVDTHSHEKVLDRMCRVITHRGPDDQGAFIEDGVALGMRRLSIIDLAGGHQPLSGCDEAVTIVFNGEIYNFRELQVLLESRGHRFHTHSDTEAIVHAYEEYGTGCVAKLRGMFSFAIWDKRTRTLFLARDRVGKKPLYYTQTSLGTLIFGSELKVLLEHPEVETEINPAALDAYLTFGYVPEPLSIFKNVHKLPAGHHLTFTGGVVSVQQYWDFTFEQVESRSEEEYVDELRALLADAVRVRLVSDVPLGAFLSGGIDSSTVVAFMAQAMTQPVKTFSIGFHEDSYNELKYARITANRFETDHHEFIVTPDICHIIDELAWHLDEPFADSSAIPTYMLSKLAREHVTVALSGDGGDELFAGYTRYVVDQQRSAFSRLPPLVRHQLIKPLSRNLPHGARGRNFLHNVALEPLDRYLDSISTFTSLTRPSLYSQEFQSQLRARDEMLWQFRAYAEQVRTGNPVDPLLYLDSKTYLPGDILTKVDRMSMAVSLEARVPLLDQNLLEFVTRIPAALKLKKLTTKYIFKRAVRGLIPDEILDRPKQGFGMPISLWINSELKDRIRETVTGSRARERGYFESDYIRILFDEHDRGRRDHSAQLWALFMLELWHRTFVDRKVEQSDVPSAPDMVSVGI